MRTILPTSLLSTIFGLFFLSSHSFARDGVWEKISTLKLDDDEIWNAHFTSSIGVHKDTMIIGTRGTKTTQSRGIGYDHVFTLRGSEWVSDQILYYLVQRIDTYCGSRVAIYGDWILVGCPSEQISGTGSGVAHLFQRQSSEWVEVKKFTSNENLIYGYSFTMVISGDFLSIGSPNQGCQTCFSGAMCNYIYTAGEWGSLGCLLPPSARGNDYFGYSAAMHNTWMAVGAPGHEIFGVVYLYSFQNNWKHTQMITGNTHRVVGDSFGYYISLHERFLAVSAPYQKMPDGKMAAVYMYTLQSNEWIAQSIVRPPDQEAIPSHGYMFSVSKNYLCLSIYQDGDYIWSYSFNGNEWVELPSFLGASPFIDIDGRFLLTKYFDSIDCEYKVEVYQNPSEFTHSQLPTESYVPQTESRQETASFTHSRTAEESSTRVSIESSSVSGDDMKLVMLTLGVISICCMTAGVWCICKRCIDQRRRADAVEQSFTRRMLERDHRRAQNHENEHITSRNTNQAYGATGLIMIEAGNGV